ncbi:MAG TPA: hypothetical protein DCW72_02250 [Elusimicrobia bacterium]|nr:MAG: hypothetical protein A2X29_00695 [Elusimicrobia bacterium GWA2_64_40]OGR66159.1 MAG: hypothetical protein A2X30_09995 [Elusimicrobia bacterium GWB2_63_16]HAU89077.1 hypothetical protein [Elusimicrobiota bacterium]
MFKVLIPALFTALLLPTAGHAGEEGYSGAQFLRLGGGARAAAMGDSAAASGGAQAMFHNPAGLTGAVATELLFSHAKWIADLNYSNLAAVRNSPGGAYGLAVSYLSFPSTDKYDRLGNKLSESYSASDMSAAVGFARKFGAATDLGVSVKYVRSVLEDETATAAAADVGFRHEAIKDKLRLGLALQNAGTKLRYIEAQSRLPLTLRFGGEYTLHLPHEDGMRKHITFATEFSHLKDAGVYAGAGIEFGTSYDKGNHFAMRLGYRTNKLGSASGISAGLAVDMKSSIAEYAYAPMGDLGNTHRLSLTVKFGKQPGVK